MTKRLQKPPVYSTFSIRLPDGVKTRADVAAARLNLSITTLVQDLLLDTFPATSALDGPLSRLAGGYDPDSEPGHRLSVLNDIRKAVGDLLPLIDVEEAKAHKDLSDAMRRASARIDAANGSDQEQG